MICKYQFKVTDIHIHTCTFLTHQRFHKSLWGRRFPRRTSSVTTELFAAMMGESEQNYSKFQSLASLASCLHANIFALPVFSKNSTPHLDPLVVKEPQEVERSKVDALLAVQCDFVAGRAAVDKINRLFFGFFQAIQSLRKSNVRFLLKSFA